MFLVNLLAVIASLVDYFLQSLLSGCYCCDSSRNNVCWEMKYTVCITSPVLWSHRVSGHSLVVDWVLPESTSCDLQINSS